MSAAQPIKQSDKKWNSRVTFRLGLYREQISQAKDYFSHDMDETDQDTSSSTAGTNFIDEVPITIQMRWKFNVTFIQILMSWW